MPPKRTTGQNHGLGKSIINRKIKDARRDPNALRIVQESENLRSVTHEGDLEEFLNSAALADTDFTAERTNVKVVSTPSIPNSKNPYLLSAQEFRALTKKQDELKGSLRVPRRAAWDETTTRVELEKNERDSFLEWRRGLAEVAEEHNLLLTPFERNLQVWRQLWRVIERSHLIVQIVDGRNPITFRCEDLENYVSEVGIGMGNKQKRGIRKSLLLINKSDLLTKQQRQAWADYFDKQNIQYAFFSAFNATAAQEQAEKQRRRQLGLDEEIKFAEDQAAAESDVEEDDSAEEEDEVVAVKKDQDDDEEDFEDVDEDEDDEDDEDPDVQNALAESIIHKQDGETKATQALRDEMENKLNIETPEFDELAENHAMKGMFDDEVDHDPRTRVLTVLELEELFERVAPKLTDFATEHNPTPDKLTVGLVGYPNVGKSSTINALLGSKKVSVSATPGKTKHFQTLPFTSKVTLCDCPGLVFPQFVHTEADMVCDGVLPIDQMREYTAPVELICRRVPREVLEGTYAIRVEVKEIEDGGTGMVHWEDFLSGYAIARGLTRASFGMPDTSRAARYVLKDYVSAKLVYCHPPPGIDSDEYMEESRFKMIAKGEEDIRLGKKKAPVTRVAKGADTYVGPAPTVPIESSADDDKQQSRERQATAKSIRQNAASAPGRSAAWKSKNLENTFFSEPGPMPRPVAKGAPGLGQEDGYSRTKLYPHAHRLGPDGLPLEMINPPLVPAKNSKKHFKHKEGKKRSGAGYD